MSKGGRKATPPRSSSKNVSTKSKLGKPYSRTSSSSRRNSESTSKPESKLPKAPIAQVSQTSQVDKVKEIETSLQTLLSNADPDFIMDSKTTGGMDARISNLTKMANKLKQVFHDQQASSKSNVEPPKFVKPNAQPSSSSKSLLPTESSSNSAQPNVTAACSSQDLLPATQQGEERTRPKNRKRFMNLDLSDNESFSEKYFTLQFPEGNIKKINPFDIKRTVKQITGSDPKALTNINKDSYCIEMQSHSQSIDILNLKKVNDLPCKVILHPTFNYSRALIYVEDVKIDNNEEFQEYLQGKYNIASVTPAPFIKTRSPDTQAYIVNFKGENLPYSIYIPGERRDTIVRKFHSKPLRCFRCQQYGHPVKYCRAVSPVCGKCANIGHSTDQCSSDVICCLHCKGSHLVGARECPTQETQIQLVEIQQQERVSLRRAKQIMENNNEYYRPPKSTFPTLFDCTMEEGQKKTLSPWLLEKSISHTIQGKPKSIRSKNKTTFTIEISTEKESKYLSSLRFLNNIPVQISVNETNNVNKGLIYVYNYDMSNFPTFRNDLMKHLGVIDVVEPTWIKRQDQMSKPLLLSFQSDVPNFVDIPGERAKTKVYEYKRRPMLCHKCQTYGHTEKYCAGDVLCGCCSVKGHRAAECAALPKCNHCGADHITGNKTCPEFRYQEEVLSIQTKEKVPRQQAIILYNQKFPDRSNNYAKAVISRPTNSQRSSSRKRRHSSEHEGNPRKRGETDVTREGTSSTRLFSTLVNLDKPSTSHMSPTSENNLEIRKETERIYNEEFRMDT